MYVNKNKGWMKGVKRKVKESFYTFIWIPHEGKVRKYVVSRKSVHVALACASIVVLLAVSAPLLFSVTFQMHSLNKALSTKVQTQKQRILEMGRKLRALEMKVADIEHLGRKIRDIAIGTEEEGESMLMGVGGVGLDVSVPQVETGERTDLLAARIGNLEKRIEQEETILDSIFTILNDKRSLLDSTPSIWPVKGWVTSEFGYRVDPFTGRQELHEGLDIAARFGTPVLATADGIVVYAKYERSFGNTVIIEHGYGFSTLYAHLAEVYVQPGQRVERGQVVGAVGNTGRSTGPHLHYEVRKNGVPVDPRDYILD